VLCETEKKRKLNPFWFLIFHWYQLPNEKVTNRTMMKYYQKAIATLYNTDSKIGHMRLQRPVFVAIKPLYKQVIKKEGLRQNDWVHTLLSFRVRTLKKTTFETTKYWFYLNYWLNNFIFLVYSLSAIFSNL